MASRAEIAAAAGKTLAAADVKKVRSVIGLDGFVDSIIEVVDKRTSATKYERMKTITEFGKKVLAAAGQSSNYEFVVTIQKLGGNGPIMANAMAAIGFPLTYIGTLGFPAVHPVFGEMAKRADVISIAEPGYTDAVEFLDGKLMFGKHQSLGDVSWENLLKRVGLAKLIAYFEQAQLIGMVNWTMLPFMTNIWERLLAEVLPKLKQTGAARRTMFIDLADPEKRTVEDLSGALATLAKFQAFCEVILGVNLKESEQVAAALGIPAAAGDGGAEGAIEQTAAAIRAKLGIGTVVIHPRKGAAAANRTETARFAGPFVEHPKISTGAGDHFNAGFVTGQVLGLTLAESLAAGTATSGFYVRNAASPSVGQLAEFLKELPAPQG